MAQIVAGSDARVEQPGAWSSGVSSLCPRVPPGNKPRHLPPAKAPLMAETLNLGLYGHSAHVNFFALTVRLISY